jgi:hypothetical protein
MHKLSEAAEMVDECFDNFAQVVFVCVIRGRKSKKRAQGIKVVNRILNRRASHKPTDVDAKRFDAFEDSGIATAHVMCFVENNATPF